MKAKEARKIMLKSLISSEDMYEAKIKEENDRKAKMKAEGKYSLNYFGNIISFYLNIFLVGYAIFGLSRLYIFGKVSNYVLYTINLPIIAAISLILIFFGGVCIEIKNNIDKNEEEYDKKIRVINNGKAK